MPLNVLCIGAHPDDCDGHMGGTAALMAKRGDRVKFVSVTDGSKGHFQPEYVANPDALARRRFAEATAAVNLIGGEFETMGVPDGEVYVNPANTEAMVRLIRNFGPPGQGPDLVLLNRNNDYHRDHRYTAQLVLDATYMLTVPPMYPDTRHLDRMPVFAYWQDEFTEGGNFQPDVIVNIESGIETMIDMICCHESQFFEWLPYNAQELDGFPKDAATRRELIASRYKKRSAERVKRYAGVVDFQGGRAPKYIEAFQISEYGRCPTDQEMCDLFPIE